MSEQKSSFMDAKTASWFAYILSFISGIIILATEKEDKTVRLHAWQSVVLCCCFTAVYIILIILSGVFFWIAWGIVAFISVLMYLLWLGYVVLTIICIIKAVQGDIFKLPVIYDKVKNFK